MSRLLQIFVDSSTSLEAVDPSEAAFAESATRGTMMALDFLAESLTLNGLDGGGGGGISIDSAASRISF